MRAIVGVIVKDVEEWLHALEVAEVSARGLVALIENACVGG